MAEPQGPTAQDSGTEASARDHLANERTLLAWMRTALTVIGLGYVVDRLALEGDRDSPLALAGVALVVLGGLIAVAGAYSFMKARDDLRAGRYRASATLELALAGSVVVGAILLLAYLVAT